MCLDRGADSIREAGSTAAATGGGAGEDAAGSQGAWQVGPNAVHQVQWHCAVCSGQLKEEKRVFLRLYCYSDSMHGHPSVE